MAGEGTGFGARLRAFRVAARLSQEDLARLSGLDVRTIRNLERGRARWPYPDTVRRLAGALDLRGTDRGAFTAAAGRRLSPGSGEAGNGPVADSGPAGPASRGPGPVIRAAARWGPALARRAGEMAALSGLLDRPGRG